MEESVMSIRVLKGIPSRMNIATPPPREFGNTLTKVFGTFQIFFYNKNNTQTSI